MQKIITSFFNVYYPIINKLEGWDHINDYMLTFCIIFDGIMMTSDID